MGRFKFTPSCELSLIVPCMGRLEQVKTHIQGWTTDPDISELVFVDWSCPDNSGDWVEANYPAARVLRVKNQKHFSLAQCRNTGAALARGKYFLFVDTDLIIQPGVLKSLSSVLGPTSWAIAEFTGGFLAVSREMFFEVGGYDGNIAGWGCEDAELLDRLMIISAPSTIPKNAISCSGHDMASRGTNYATKNLWWSCEINSTYRTIKTDLMHNMSNMRMSHQYRKYLYTIVSQAWEKAFKEDVAVTFEITIPPARSAVTAIEKTIRYTIRCGNREELKHGLSLSYTAGFGRGSTIVDASGRGRDLRPDKPPAYTWNGPLPSGRV